MFSEDQELYWVSVVAKHDDGKYLVHFIDFGNTEVKLQSELFNIPALVYIQHIFLIYSRTLLDFIQAFGAYDWGKTVPQFYDSLRTDWLCKQTSRNGDCWLHGKNLILQILHSSKKSAMVIFPSSEMIICLAISTCQKMEELNPTSRDNWRNGLFRWRSSELRVWRSGLLVIGTWLRNTLNRDMKLYHFT